MSGGAEPGAYPGNLSLPREVRDKILSTFRHTLNLYKEGKTDDCLIGCDFILKMDPRFAPARQLIEKAKNPANEIDVASLEAIVAETPSRPERVATPETDRLIVRAAESFNARDFDAAIAAAEQVLQVLPGNQDAAQILEKARQKKSAQPQFEVARQRAIAALDGHRASEARAALDKMRSLDPEHPAVALLDRRLAAPAPAEVGESTNPGFAITPSAPTRCRSTTRAPPSCCRRPAWAIRPQARCRGLETTSPIGFPARPAGRPTSGAKPRQTRAVSAISHSTPPRSRRTLRSRDSR
jgi:tetratricopeptide (TPR) repeat protein